MAETFSNQPGSTQNRIYTLVAGLIILTFLISGIATLHNYGMSWDEGLGNAFFGERYLHYLTSFQEKYLDFKAELPMHAEYPLDLFKSTWKNNPEVFPAFADIASAATMYLFSYGLHWLDPVDGFHLFTILLTAVFLYFVYRFTSHRLGQTTALFALLFLALYPRLWGDMHFNEKDMPEMVFFCLALMAFWWWYEKPGWGRSILTGLLTGAALGIKANALFLPFMMILGAWPISLRGIWRHLKITAALYAVMAASTIGFYFLSWPYLYSNPMNALKYFGAILTQGGRGGSSQWNWEPLGITAATMPEIMLLCSITGLILASLWILRKKSPIMRFVFVWCLFPLLRISLPPSENFDGVRHFLEFLPAAAILAGFGAARIIDWMGKSHLWLKKLGAVILPILILANAGLNFKEFGNYQHIYFNSLVGGLPGGAKLFGPSEATDYWAVSYRQGLEWLSQNAPPNSVLHVPVGGHLADLTAPLWLRPDIQLIGEEALTARKQAGQTVYVMYVTRPQFYTSAVEGCLKRQTFVFQIKVQMVPILQVCSW